MQGPVFYGVGKYPVKTFEARRNEIRHPFDGCIVIRTDGGQTGLGHNRRNADRSFGHRLHQLNNQCRKSRDYTLKGHTSVALSPEVLLISSIVNTQDMKTALAEGLSEDLFHVCTEEYEWLARYYGKYRRTPSKVAFKRAYPNFRLRDVDDTKHFVQEVKVEHTKSLLTEHLRDQADLIAQGKIGEAVDMGRSGIVKIAGSLGVADEVDVLENWQSTYKDVKARKLRLEQFGMSGVPTGIPTVDEMTGGVQPGQLWIVGARLGEGKSWILATMTVAAIIGEYRAHFSALEMTKSEMSMRLHNLLSSSYGRQVFQSVSLSQGKNYDLKAYRNFLEELPKKVKGHLTVSDRKNIGAMEIAAQLERNKPDVYFLDYLTLAKMRGDGGWQDVGAFSKDLKTLGNDYQCGIVSAAQLNRAATESGKEPAGAETIAQADGIGQDADAVLTMKKLSDSITMMKMAKYRHGRSGFCWYMHMDLDNGVITEVSKNRAEDIMDRDAERRDKLIEAPRIAAKRKVNAQSTDKIQSTQQETIASGARGRLPRKTR